MFFKRKKIEKDNDENALKYYDQMGNKNKFGQNNAKKPV